VADALLEPRDVGVVDAHALAQFLDRHGQLLDHLLVERELVHLLGEEALTLP
jgi:hypothetical protein